MTVFAGIAEFERDLIGDRTSAGRETPDGGEFTWRFCESLPPEHAKLVRWLLDERKSVREIVDTFNIHTATIYRLSATAA
jgi:DNA invertase Pin-like site-specific DNA recombinase